MTRRPCDRGPRPRLVFLTCLLVLVGLGVALRCGDDDDNNNHSGNNNNASADAAVSQDADLGDAAPLLDATVSEDASAAAGHTDNQSGHYHMTGKEDPLQNCVGCHGGDLRGGAGPSCYSCHNADDHSADRMGVKHRFGSSGTCIPCHGPNNTGGLGPSCQGTGCH